MNKEEAFNKLNKLLENEDFRLQEEKRYIKKLNEILLKKSVSQFEKMKLMKKKYLNCSKLQRLQELEHKVLLTSEEVELRYSIKERTQKKYREEKLIPYVQPKNPHGFRKKGYNVMYIREKLDEWARLNSIEIKREKTF